MDLAKSFIIGTSILAASPHLTIVGFLRPETFNFSYPTYSLLVPFYFGFMNMLSTFLANRFGWNLRERLLWISLISIILVTLFNYVWSSRRYIPYQDYDRKDWITYWVSNGLLHFVVFNLIIYFLERLFRT